MDDREPDRAIENKADVLERIRELAYALWIQDGSQHGRDRDYWFQAEREVTEEHGLSLATPAISPSHSVE
jgi:hypothetical protein